MKKQGRRFEFALCGVLASIGCAKPALPDNSSGPLITQSPQVKEPENESTLSFSDEALREIQRVASQNEIDWSIAVIRLYLENADDGKRHVQLRFEQRNKITEQSHKVLQFGSVPVAVPTSDISTLDGIRVAIGDRDGKPGFVFEQQSGKE